MKKALSVAVYNHFCDVALKRNMARMESEEPPLESPLVGNPNGKPTAERYQRHFRQEEEVEDEEDKAERKNSNDSGYGGGEGGGGGGGGGGQGGGGKREPKSLKKDVQVSPIRTGRMLTPIVRGIAHYSSLYQFLSKTKPFFPAQVSRVIIEASTHKVHLRRPNVLTFDSTGSSRPLDAIATELAR